MADWYGTSRSNYVKFIPEKLEVLKELFEIYVVQQDDRHATISMTPDGGNPVACMMGDLPKDLLERLGFPPPRQMWTEVYFLEVLPLALIPDKDNVSVWKEVGAEGTQELTGWATALDHIGRIQNSVNLDNIYLSKNWSRAEY